MGQATCPVMWFSHRMPRIEDRLPNRSAPLDRAPGALIRALIRIVALAGLSAAAAACGSSSAHPAQPPAPAAGTVGTEDVDINAINPIGPFFEHRLDYGITDSQVTKLSALDSRYTVGARPMRRMLDSLRTLAHEFDGYLPPPPKNADKNADTSHAHRSARDSVQALHDAIADVSAQLRARARRTRAEALDILTLEQLERVAQVGNGSNNFVTAPVSNRRGGTNGGGGYNQQPGNTTTRLIANSVPSIRDPLRGITLSDSQRVKIDSIRAAYRSQARDLGDPGPALVAPIRDLIRRQNDAIRDVLTPDQQARFDRNRTPAAATPGNQQGSKQASQPAAPASSPPPAQPATPPASPPASPPAPTQH